MERHIAELRNGLGKTALKVGDRAPAIVLDNARGETVDVGRLLQKGPVVVAFYRGGWCPYCNLELRAFQRVLPDINAAGASLVAISPEKPDDALSTAETPSVEILSLDATDADAPSKVFDVLKPDILVVCQGDIGPGTDIWFRSAALHARLTPLIIAQG